MKKISLAILLSTAMITSVNFAMADEVKEKKWYDGIYLKAGLGYGDFASTIELDRYDYNGNLYNTEPNLYEKTFLEDFIPSFAIGMSVTDNIELELEYSRFSYENNFGEKNASWNDDFRYITAITTNVEQFSVIASYYFNDYKEYTPYIGAGFGMSDHVSKLQPGADITSEYSSYEFRETSFRESKNHLILKAGLSKNISENTSLFAEYAVKRIDGGLSRFYMYNQGSSEEDEYRYQFTFEEKTKNLTTLSLGIKYKF